MIKNLRIQNFQSHKNTQLSFDPGVNTIIGPSDSGKTSIIRALRWLVWNRPLGDSFRSSWGGDTEVDLETNDDFIQRHKGSDDWYLLKTPENEYEFKAFGRKPPEEVKKVLNISSINLQQQMDSPFLISDNSGEVSRHFNKVARIDQIDSSLKAVEGWVRSINSDIKGAKKEIERYQDSLKEYEYLGQMEKDIEILEAVENQKSKKQKNCYELGLLSKNIKNVDEEISNKSILLPAESLVNGIIKLFEAKNKVHQKSSQIKDVLNKIDTTEQKLDNLQVLVSKEEGTENILNLITKRKKLEKKETKLNSLIHKIKSVDREIAERKTLTSSKDLVDPILRAHKKRRSKSNEINKLGSLNDEIDLVNSNLQDRKEELEQLEKKWHEQVPEECPICGNKMN
jgi:chromosome segregation ATPase